MVGDPNPSQVVSNWCPTVSDRGPWTSRPSRAGGGAVTIPAPLPYGFQAGVGAGGGSEAALEAGHVHAAGAFVDTAAGSATCAL